MATLKTSYEEMKKSRRRLLDSTRQGASIEQGVTQLNSERDQPVQAKTERKSGGVLYRNQLGYFSEVISPSKSSSREEEFVKRVEDDFMNRYSKKAV